MKSLALVLLFAPVASHALAEDPQAAKTVEQLDTIAKKGKGSEVEYANALHAAINVPDPKVAHAVARALRNDDPRIERVAADALGRMKCDEALTELHTYYEYAKGKKPRDEKTFAELIRAIGRHGSMKSLAILSEETTGMGPFDHDAYIARLFSIGHVRDKAAIDKLVSGRQPIGDGLKAEYFEEFHIALCVLTGQNRGTRYLDWKDWWEANRNTFVMPTEEAALHDEKKFAKRWEKFWDRPVTLDDEPEEHKRPVTRSGEK